MPDGPTVDRDASEASDAVHRLRDDLDLTHARIEALEAELDAIVTSAAGANLDDEHDPEGSTVGFERARVASLLADAHRHRALAEDAFRRLASGAYGRCERCQEPIPAERLGAVPTAQTCVRCATLPSR